MDDDRTVNEFETDEPVLEPADSTTGPPEIPQASPDRTWLIAGAVGALMLVLGAFLGYFGRGQFGPEAQAARAEATVTAGVVQTQSAASAQMMQYLIENARHFKGEESAPVTIIEFSDFQ